MGSGGTVLTSPTGQLWELKHGGVEGSLLDVIRVNGQYIAVGYETVAGNTRGLVIRSTDGTEWTVVPSASSIPLDSIAYGDGVFLAGGGTSAPSSYDSAGLFMSVDGVHWSPQSYGSTAKLAGIASIDHTFLLLGGSGTLLQSDRFGDIFLRAERSGTEAFQLTVAGGEMGGSYEVQACADLTGRSWTRQLTLVQNQYLSHFLFPYTNGFQQYFRVLKTGP